MQSTLVERWKKHTRQKQINNCKLYNYLNFLWHHKYSMHNCVYLSAVRKQPFESRVKNIMARHLPLNRICIFNKSAHVIDRHRLDDSRFDFRFIREPLLLLRLNGTAQSIGFEFDFQVMTRTNRAINQNVKLITISTPRHKGFVREVAYTTHILNYANYYDREISCSILIKRDAIQLDWNALNFHAQMTHPSKSIIQRWLWGLRELAQLYNIVARFVLLWLWKINQPSFVLKQKKKQNKQTTQNKTNNWFDYKFVCNLSVYFGR